MENMEERKWEKRSHTGLIVAIVGVVAAIVIGAILLFGGGGGNARTLPNGAPVITDAPDSGTNGYGNKVKGDILFDDLPWGTTREEVFKALQRQFPSIEEEKCNDYDYGKIKVAICTYGPGRYSYGHIGQVGDMDVDEITVWYIYEPGTYNYAIYAAQYVCESLSPYNAMVEMLTYKYGQPYSHYTEKSNPQGARFDIDRYTWANEDLSQKMTITRSNNVYDFGSLVGADWGLTYEKETEIYYRDVFVSNYVSQQRQKHEAEEKEQELSNKNYNGL